MWIMLSDSALSIVQKHLQPPGTLTVRARVRGDIERVFPKAKVETSAYADYAYRAVVPREEVAEAMAKAVRSIDYDNFKATVREDDRHDAYLQVWRALMNLQIGRARAEAAPRAKRGKSLF